ncbi:hypothetical protein ACFXKY_15255 [Streptomyces canus]|uniref:hypothetical protein n=1 Tax=Streptomyces canus TaxID=58343 RepID=UPI003694671A
MERFDGQETVPAVGGLAPRPVKALVAVEGSIITAIQHVITDNVIYPESSSSIRQWRQKSVRW